MEVIGQLAAVAGVLTLLVTTLWWLRRRGFAATVLPTRRSAHKKLELLERLPLGPQHTLHLVRVGETALLVAASPAGCALMQSFPSAEVGARAEVAR